MKKETVIRQNRCDHEMNFLLFVCFTFFAATQLFVGDNGQRQLINTVNMLLYGIFVPGFIFRLGYCYGTLVRQNSAEYRAKWLLHAAGRYFLYFFLLTLAMETKTQLIGAGSVNKKMLIFSILADVISLLRVPAVSAVFLTMALILVVVRFADAKLIRLIRSQKLMLLVGILLLASALLRTDSDAYVITASLFGSAVQPAVPGVPYFAFFLLGIWIEEKKPAFDWKLALGSAALATVSLLLYRTPLRDLCRVTASLLPVYAIYVLAEFLSEVTLRVRAARFVCEKIDWFVGVYSLILLGLSVVGFQNAGLPRAFLLALCAMALVAAGCVGFFVFAKCYGMLCGRVQAKVRHKTVAYFVLYTAAFSVVLLLAFASFAIRGRTFIHVEDGLTQYFPKAVYFSRYIREFFADLFAGQAELPMYDFTAGLGAEITYSLEPLYFLYALFPEKYLEFAYSFTMILRFYLSGVAFSALCLYFGKGYFVTFLGSVVYVVCGFVLNGGTVHFMFMVPMIMLPLLILSVEEILRHKRWYLCTIFVAVSLFSNYYFLYMNTIAMGVYFLVRFFLCREKERRTVKEFWGRAFVTAGSYLLGVAMSCIVLVTTFGMYLGSGRSDAGAAYIKTPSLFFYRIDWLVSCFLTFLTTANAAGEWMRLGFLPVAMLAMGVLFLRKGRKELKILSVVALIFAAFPVFGFIFSGFSTVINRWSYMIALLVAFVVAECYPDLLALKKREKQILAGLIAVYGFLGFFGNYKRTTFVQIAFILLAVTFAVVLFIQESNKKVSHAVKRSMMLVLTAGIVLYQGISLYELDGAIEYFAEPGEAQARELDTPLRAVAELEDDSFYRSATPKLTYSTINAPTILGINSNTMFNSTYNGNLMEYLEEMGCTGYSKVQMRGMSNRTFLDSLAAMKYYAYYDEPDLPLPFGYEEVLQTELDGKATTVCENQYALPLGYTYEEAISEEELEQYPVLERQEVMMQRAVLSGADISAADGKEASEQAEASQIEVTTKQIDIENITEKGAHIEENALVAGSGETIDAELSGKEKNTYKVTLEFQSEPNSETYIVLHNAFLEENESETPIQLTFKAGGDKLTYKFHAENYRYGTGQDDYVFNLGYHEEPITSCTITMNRSGRIELEDFGVYCQPMANMEQYTERLTRDVLENVQLGTNEVSGTISLDEDKYLALSIPYQNGWTAYVDDEEVPLYRANYTYMALKLEPGEHTIRLTFEIPGVKYALVIMAAAVVLFIVVCFVSWQIRRKKRTKTAV